MQSGSALKQPEACDCPNAMGFPSLADEFISISRIWVAVRRPAVGGSFFDRPRPWGALVPGLLAQNSGRHLGSSARTRARAFSRFTGDAWRKALNGSASAHRAP